MDKKKIVAIIPARMRASRFPGKPLAMIKGLPLVEHVRRRVCLSKVIDEVYVATCDEEIMKAVIDYGGRAVMTKDTHERCTDRVEEASQGIDLDISVIVQGDEPLFMPDILEELVKPMLEDDSLDCVSLLSKIKDKKDLDNIDIVKAVLDKDGYIMCFSRSPLPHLRVDNGCPLYRQTGVSAFLKQFLRKYTSLPPTPLEIAESVDFLRMLEHRYLIRSVIYEGETAGVDRPKDVAKVENILDKDPEQKRMFERIMDL